MDVELLESLARRIERIAFSMPAPNPYTPELAQLAIAMRDHAARERVEQAPEKD